MRWARGRDAQGAAELVGPGSHLQLVQVPRDQIYFSKEDSGIWVGQGPEVGKLWAPAGEV